MHHISQKNIESNSNKHIELDNYNSEDTNMTDDSSSIAYINKLCRVYSVHSVHRKPDKLQIVESRNHIFNSAIGNVNLAHSQIDLNEQPLTTATR